MFVFLENFLVSLKKYFRYLIFNYQIVNKNFHYLVLIMVNFFVDTLEEAKQKINIFCFTSSTEVEDSIPKTRKRFKKKNFDDSSSDETSFLFPKNKIIPKKKVLGNY